MSDQDTPQDQALSLFKTLAEMGGNDFTTRRQDETKKLMESYARVSFLLDQDKLPVGFAIQLTEFLNSVSDAAANQRPVPELGSGSSSTGASNNSGNGGVQLSDDEKAVLRSFRAGNFKLDARGQVAGLEQNSQLSNALQHIERELGLGYVEGDSPRDRANRIKTELDKVKATGSSGGKTVDLKPITSELGLKNDASIQEIVDAIKKSKASAIDLKPIAKALGMQNEDAPLGEIVNASKQAALWERAAADVNTAVKEITGLDVDGKESHVTYVTRGLEHGPAKSGLLSGRRGSRGK